jgi:Icc protein
MDWNGSAVRDSGGVLKSYSLSRLSGLGSTAAAAGELSLVQISDSHMEFNKPANPDVAGTRKAAVDKINGLSAAPEFMLHTGDISHLSKPEEFDTVDQILKSATPKDVFYVPGEHDVLNDDGKQFLERYGKGCKGAGWYSFDKKGVHFIGLVNVMNLKAGGLGTLGHDQLEWLEGDVKQLNHSTPIVVFAHIPLWSVYPEWGWGTEYSAQELAYLKKFGSVTVLKRTYPADDAEGRGQRDVPHGGIDGISATAAGQGRFAWTHEGARGTTAERPWDHGCELRPRATRAGGRGLDARVSRVAQLRNYVDQK